MPITLQELPHQTECLNRVLHAFYDVPLKCDPHSPFANPTFNTSDPKLLSNIEQAQNGKVNLGYGYERSDYKAIDQDLRQSDPKHFGLDVRMETGTGKTYCYTRLMFGLNQAFGFHKFILLLPTVPIKEGTKAFIESDYAKKHFADLYPKARLNLSVLEPQKSNKGKKRLPHAISDFARDTAQQKNNFSVLLMSSGMLNSKATMDTEYDQTLLSNFSKPYDILKATRPIVIIDEPHKFKKDNTAYKRLIEKINPLAVIRFGATFPNLGKNGQKDYNNLLFNLTACDAFNGNLVKGVATQMIAQESENLTRIKLTDFSPKEKTCRFKNESNGKTYTLGINDSLAQIDPDFGHLCVSVVGKTEDEEIKNGVTLSNGQIVTKGEGLYAGIFSQSYQELMLRQAVENHLQTEWENFRKPSKIKTLSLFFIDSIASYRGEEGDGPLRLLFQRLLKQGLEKMIDLYDRPNNTDIQLEYASFLKASLADLSATNGGYFSEDNASGDEAIKKEVDQILRDKQSLLAFKDGKGQWNTRRFIFSKWTLREGWDNPNVFQICKLRSSGSDISKLQEVGRGLRLPVDEHGNRIEQQFYLTYLVDFSEKDFAETLRSEVNGEVMDKIINVKPMLNEVAKQMGMLGNQLFIKMIEQGYVNLDGDVLAEKQEEFLKAYPEYNKGVKEGKILSKNELEKGKVRIRKEQFAQLKELWMKINQKYYVAMENIDDDEIKKAIVEDILLKESIYAAPVANTFERKSKLTDGKLEFEEHKIKTYALDDILPYGEFLKQVQLETGVSMKIMHEALCEYSKSHAIKPNFFNSLTKDRFVAKFKAWFEGAFDKRYSYKALKSMRKSTVLTDETGEPLEKIIQADIGVNVDKNSLAPQNFLYDKVVYDSEKERETIKQSEDESEVVVFGKIPRRSVRVPLYFGETTSPDFMYVVKKGDGSELNLIVETKDVEQESGLRETEQRKIRAAKKFFETLKEDGVNVTFKAQLSRDGIARMIRDLC